MTLQEQMIDYRAKNNRSMKEFARQAGLTIQTVMHVERGLQNPSRLTLAKIQRVIGENNED